MLLKKRVKKKSKTKSENTPRQIKMETQLSKTYGCSRSNSQRELQSYTGLLQGTTKNPNKQPTI